MELESNWFLYFSAIVANLFSISSGAMMVWNSPMLPKLRSNDTSVNPLEEPVSLMELSTISVIYPIGQAIGTVLFGRLPDVIGRKTSLVSINLAGIVFIIGLSMANHVYLLYIFLPLIAAVMSASTVVVPLYVAEIAEDHNRGNLGCFYSLLVASGQLYSYVLGALTEMRLFSLLCGVPLVVLLVLSVFIPESPVYLSSKGKKSQALLALQKLRRHKTLPDVEAEYNERQCILENKKVAKDVSIRSFFASRAIRKGLLLSVAARMLQQLAGMHIILTFLETILSEIGTNMPGNILAIIVSSVKVSTGCLAVIVMEKVGRRLLMLLASFVCGLSMFSLGLYFYFQYNDCEISDTVKLLPVFFVISFVALFTLGLSTVPFVIVAELLPDEVKAFGYSIAQFAGNICTIFVSFVFPISAAFFGIHYCMFMFSFICFSGFIFIFLMLPETRGKTYAEIRFILNK